MIIWHVGGGGGGYGKAQDLAEKYRAETTFHLFEANDERSEADFAKSTMSVCLGDSVGSVPFHIYEYEPCSSIFRINPKHALEITGNPKLRTWGDHGAISKTRNIRMMTVDYLASGAAAPDFLSLDAQGAEYKILCGATKTLPNIIGILTEFQTAEVYEGQELFHDQLKLLHEKGFRLADLIYKEYWRRDGTKLLTSGDALFFNFANHLTTEQVATRDRIASFFGVREEA